ncbi:malate dehydrogenase [Candidatus Methylacidithermus pantelleriae]|uniref:Malate dehydrogenase n=1 Tax=Candidatus Methylacidithermus pantelleriae TaxID=2744239 RepID=A0A8J2BML7_9BACT|nr:malate dehydrogenase [Candidatus Methylacidithermus pantelleriae]CAF0689817.1 Malate dehydrogenase [Candidatus Methylacidithermus pantelleriae]
MKVAVIGAGAVGTAIAAKIVERNLADVVLVDVVPGLAEGKALDILHASPILGFTRTIRGTTELEACLWSELVVVACGRTRQPGMTREELLEQNAATIREVAATLRAYAPGATVLVVTNPLDVMTWLVAEVTGFPRKRVLGMAGVLDAARLRYLLGQELGVAPKDVSTLVLGSHGEQMLPLLGYTFVGGVPVKEKISQAQWDELVRKTREAGADIVRLLQKGSASYAPAVSVVEMVEAILLDQKRILVASVWCDGPYGIRGAYLGLPVLLGREGIEAIQELSLSQEELLCLQRDREG